MVLILSDVLLDYIQNFIALELHYTTYFPTKKSSDTGQHLQLLPLRERFLLYYHLLSPSSVQLSADDWGICISYLFYLISYPSNVGSTCTGGAKEEECCCCEKHPGFWGDVGEQKACHILLAPKEL